MTNQEAIIQLTERTNIYGFTDEDNEALDLAIEALKERPTGKWIPVSERLPEKNVEVLATTDWGAVTIAERYSANDWFIHEGNSNADTDEITAWMPLPEPYKKGAEQ